ncbi:Zn(2)-C6 fungal-type DNA-binding domain protein [Apiospora kogelbergensis]|uniref:Zn(2)-C6 fungal-type DNA-binding domain protein n=1 Tax=Apiospora kogelbergensis TaxID=1337665 RepID=A0AAW0QMM1_9PEZI
MIARGQCWTCCRREALCDGRKPTCERCEAVKLECMGYGADGLRGTGDTYRAPNQEIEPPPSGPEQKILPDAIRQSPTTSLYRRAQMIFEGLEYFNKLISPNIISDASHFNPYIVNLKRLESFPDHYVKVLVATAGFHRLMTAGPEPTPSSALIQRDVDIFGLRSEALGALNDQLAEPGAQTSDATLLTVVALLITSMQSSVHTEWRAHLEGARHIIHLRGGLKKIIENNQYFKPILIYFIMADVMGATTCSSKHKNMPVATLMALKYWEIEPNVLRLLAATPNPCPEEIFQSIILINYLRTIARDERSRKRRRSGTRMVLAKIIRFSPAEYAARMHNFTGWNTSGKDVGFAKCSPSTDPGSQRSDSSPESASSAESPKSISDQDLWFSVATVYRAASLIYGLRTLVVDADDDATLLLPPQEEGAPANDVAALREDARKALTDTLTPVFSDQDTMYRIGKLVMWPLFILGMEVHHQDTAQRRFFVDGFSMLSQTMGVLGPVGAIDELCHKWALEAERPQGDQVAWDDYFEGRPDYIVF